MFEWGAGRLGVTGRQLHLCVRVPLVVNLDDHGQFF